jgi:hypothetical protein
LKRLLLLLLILFSKLCYPQDTLYVLHSSVGSAISKEEKKKYFLFSDVKDSLFSYAFISHVKEKYYLNVQFGNDSVSRREVAYDVLMQYRANIDKLNEFYANKAKRDSTGKVDSGNPLYRDNDEHSKPETITLSKEMQDEARQNIRLREDEERMKSYRQGTNLDPSNITIFESKPKPKKKK